MRASSNAYTFFKSIPTKAGCGFKFLEKLSQPSSQADENEWRDFKEAKPLTCLPDDPIPVEKRRDNEGKIKRIWSENIGSFANSGGGVLIWGIKTSGKYADKLSLASDAQGLANRLQELANDAVDPPVQGIQIRAFPKSRSSKEGFVVCFIPPSNHAPHRSKFAEREFYIRAQDSNVNCQTAVLRRLFYPTASPRLVPEVALAAVIGADENYHLSGSIHICNRGHMSAKESFIRFEGTQELVHNESIWEKGPRNIKEFWSKRTIHPGQSVMLASHISKRGGHIVPVDRDVIETFGIEVYVNNATPIKLQYSVSWGQLLDAMADANPLEIEGQDYPF